ncbi:Tetratricopeptide repeat-containing protein [Candidatus Kryptobacter tengchongensis]|nr:Tetratricopeptide repeat-containing protein [Candidatus Kryptobacter tengchongensis]
MKINFIKALFLIIINFAFAQTQNELNLLRLAQSFERAGEYERALKIYEELYTQNPENRVYLEALVRLNIQTKNYEKAINLARLWLSSHPDDIDMMGKLGDAHFKAGKEKEAIEIWDKAVRTFRNNPGVYRMIADYLIQNRLYDKAIEYLTTAQKIAGVSELYSFEIAMLYEFTMRFDKAVEEYIKILRRTPSMIPSVKSRMSSYIDRPEVVKQILPVLESEAKISKQNIGIIELYSWVLIEAKDYQKALEVQKQLDKITFANGEVILNFARDLFNQGIYHVAVKAYASIVENYPDSKILPEAKFGLIRSNEEMLRLKFGSLETPDSLFYSQLQGVENDYIKFSNEYAGTKYEAEALFRLGLLKLDIHFDLDQAQRYFEEIERKFMLHLGKEAILKLGEILTLKGDINSAREKYLYLMGVKNFADSLRVKFLLAQLDYYEGNFNLALKTLEEISKFTSSDFSNDAIELMLKIQSNRFPSDEYLKMFAISELKIKQRKFGEAISLLEDINSKCPNCPIADDVIFTLSKTYFSINKFDEALKYAEILLNEHPESIYIDDALMEKGLIFQKLGKTELAIDSYTKLISKFPNSIFVNEARKKIRELRGEIQ